MRTKDEPVERGVRLGNDKGCSEAARVVWGNGAKRGVASRTRLSPLLTSRERAAGVAGCVTREGSDKTSVTRHGATDRGVVWWVGRAWRTGNEPSGEGRDRPTRLEAERSEDDRGNEPQAAKRVSEMGRFRR